MKLVLELKDRRIDADFEIVQGVARLTLDGRVHEAEIQEPEPGLFTLVLNQRVYQCTIETPPGGAPEALVNGRRIPVAVYDKKRMRGQTGGAAGASGRATLIAPMPGKIVRVLLAPGDEVAAQQGVLVVEAMKMQNEVQSPKAGRVAEIRVAEGQTVNAGETLAVIE